MFRIPHRTSLVAQTRESLLEYIAQHKAGEALPGERQLCDLLKVSRVTLRAALAELTRERLITGGSGRLRLIKPHSGRLSTLKRNVVVLSPDPLPRLEPRAIFMLDELRENLGSHGLHLDFICQPSFYSTRPTAALEQLRSRLRPACWVLYRSTREMQEWMVSHQLPALIIGSPHSSIRLPAVDVDLRAASRHAAESLAAKGHRMIALLHPRSKLAGIIESELGFQEVSARHVTAVVARHNGTPAGVRVTLDRLLGRKPAPTGFVVARPTHALTALGHLASRGFKVPQDVSLLALEYDSFLEHTVPLMSCYRVDPVTFARKVSRNVLTVAAGGETGYHIKRVMPEFIRGETLG